MVKNDVTTAVVSRVAVCVELTVTVGVVVTPVELVALIVTVMVVC